MCCGECAEVRGSPQVSILAFHLVWDSISLCLSACPDTAAYARLADLHASEDSVCVPQSCGRNNRIIDTCYCDLCEF